jgi:chromosome segregation ATPase
MKNIFLFSILLIFAGCGMKQLKDENEALKNELEVTKKANQTLYEVGVILDSIDANRDNLTMRLEQGTSYDEYVNRVRDLNNYVKSSEKRLNDLEASLKKADQSKSALAASVKKLRKELDDRNKYISFLEGQINNIKVQKDSLVTITEVQKQQLSEMDQQIQQKTQELNLIEARIVEMMKQAKVNEADSYFERGAAIEEAANRTKLAPRKKKETYKEAIELYKKALDLGREDARAKILELSKKVD